MNTSTEREELAWAAGFFDGEGSTILTTKTDKRLGQLSLSVAQSADPETLYRFRDAVKGVGVVRGPYQPRYPGCKIVFVYCAYGHERVQAIIAMMWPWLSSAKRAQASERLVIFRDAHWVLRWKEEVCTRGHRWNDGFWYINSRGTKVCRMCTREDHRWALDKTRVRAYKPRPSRQAERILTDVSDA
jgi:hypothetical protein